MKLSIIVPAYNEAANIQRALQPLQPWRAQGHEVIVADGGSSDQTLELARALSDSAFLSQKKGRAAQMNAGAALASGDVLLFLHADTTLPDSTLSDIEDAIFRQQREWGRFNVRLSGSHVMFRVIEHMMNWRSCITGVATGDQAIYVTKNKFNESGGFSDMPLMEDVEFSKRLKLMGKPACLRSCVVTSSRRWEEKGIYSTILLMWRLRLAYFLGASPEKLARLYR